ncbi:MAG TPA: hypothetical protein VFB80_03650 [Pirellulaceae bacterium]|nr:hypothetical protein [Pirellulaceae bacterium]
MQPHALPMSEASCQRVPELLRSLGFSVEPHHDINEFKMLRCAREGVGVLLSMNKPAHWAAASDERKNLVMVAAIGESMFRFWRIPRESRIAREVIDLLRPLEWRPH